MVDDDGDIMIDSSKTVVCNGGQQKSTREVFFQSPIHCEDSDVPDPPSSTGVITATASGSPGTDDHVEDLTIRCNE
jgi:hypothetical protein